MAPRNTKLWTRLRCSRRRFTEEHPGRPQPGDLDRECVLCRAPLGSVTTFAISGCSSAANALRLSSGAALGNEAKRPRGEGPT